MPVQPDDAAGLRDRRGGLRARRLRRRRPGPDRRARAGARPAGRAGHLPPGALRSRRAGSIEVAGRIEVRVSYTRRGSAQHARASAARDRRPRSTSSIAQLVVNYAGPARRRRRRLGTYLIICPNDSEVIDAAAAAGRLAHARRASTSIWPRPPRPARPRRASRPASRTPTTPGQPARVRRPGRGRRRLDRDSLLVREPLRLRRRGRPSYTQLAGGDILADVHIGRLSFNTTDRARGLREQDRRLREHALHDRSGWFTRACLVGDPSHSGYSCIQVMQWIKTRLRQSATPRSTRSSPSPFVSQMTTASTAGDTFFCYRGYYGMSGWSNSTPTP